MAEHPGEVPGGPKEPINPYAAPEADITAAPMAGSEEMAELEAIRRKHLNHEASIKSIGSLHYISAIFSFLGVAGMVVAMVSGPLGPQGSLVGVLVGTYSVVFAINAALGYGLTGLHNWARWVETALVCLWLLWTVGVTLWVSAAGLAVGPQAVGMVVVVAIGGYILYLLLSKKGATVFSPEYREVMARTPHIKYKTSCLVKFLLLLVLGLIVVAVAGAILGRVR